jgi:hypothetical protein
MINRNLVTAAMLALTPLQRDDCLSFQRHKKWSAPLFALHYYLDQSTAHRRLKRLVAAGVVDVRRGQLYPNGGRETDVYYVTPLGTRVITRLKGLGSSYVEAPDVSDPYANQHDLAVLEIAIRSSLFQEARAFEQQKIIRTDGSPFVLIPDLYFGPNVFLKHGLYVEVEQTVKPEHVTGKYEQYAQLIHARLLHDKVMPRLAVIFPTDDAEEVLYRDHIEAARAAIDNHHGVRLPFYTTPLPTLRRRHVRSFERKTAGTLPNGQPIIEIEGLLQCLEPLLE